MVYHPQFLRLFLSLIAVALVSSADEGPQPGDPFDANIDLPNWWFELKDKYESKEVRKCAFLQDIPNTNDYCPHFWDSRGNVKDHYYCIFGTEERPTWFCTCARSVDDNGKSSNDFQFHCGSELLTVDDIHHQAIDMEDVNEQSTTNSVNDSVETLEDPDMTTGASTENGSDSPIEQPPTESSPVKGPRPGDVFDYNSYEFPQWWYSLRDQYAFREVRKCPFLREIPDTGDFCPAIAKSMDHYYCVFGTEDAPTWFCTCTEVAVGTDQGLHFHCSDTELLTVEHIRKGAGKTENI